MLGEVSAFELPDGIRVTDVSFLAIQGLGDGGIISLSEIIISDLVPLSERGTYEGVLGVVWAVASAMGPPLGGLFSRGKHWRWLFCERTLFSVCSGPQQLHHSIKCSHLSSCHRLCLHLYGHEGSSFIDSE